MPSLTAISLWSKHRSDFFNGRKWRDQFMWFLALRQMLARKKQTLLIFLGISLGTTIYVVIAGMQLGMRNYISEQLLNNTAHVIIKGNEQQIRQEDLRDRFFEETQFVRWIVPPAGKRGESRLENPQGWFSRLDKDPRVLAYSPRLWMEPGAPENQYWSHWNNS